MFFILSKLLSFFIKPIIWILVLLIFGLIIKNPQLKQRCLKGALILFILFSNTVIFSEFARLWEVEGVNIEETSTFDIAVVLGGMTEYNNDFDRLSIRRGGDRIWQAVKLYQLKKVKKILISGANGHLIDKGLMEATQLKEDLIMLGVPSTNILTDSISRNTHENAIESKKIIDRIEGEPRILLITSAMHMKRASACFKKVGFTNFGVFTTDHYTGIDRGYQFDQFFIPNVGTLSNWNGLIKEWVGYMIYALVGYL